jgi:hypothetical protein
MRNSSQSKASATSRRGMLFGATAVAAGATALSTLPQAQLPSVAEEPKPAPAKGGGYSVSEHVKRYYQTTLV